MRQIQSFYRQNCAKLYSAFLFWTALMFCLLASFSAANAQTFSNPLFPSQDPYVTFWEGNYYYTDAGNNGIHVTKSPTLTGLSSAPPLTVWTSPWVGPDGHANLWGPEIHQVNGKWYIYFSADYQSNGRHRLYVLEGGKNPLDPYQVANTGSARGQLVESTGKWAIDPDVFVGADNQLYLTWSCTNYDIGTTPQFLCLAPMADALHTAGPTVRISTPTESWETRTAAVEEGPIGFVHNGVTYITFSGSASWTPNDYSVGVLTNSGGNLLDPHSWVKHGPILDHHGAAYGPGSVVFAPSADGTELWSLYHAYDRLNCGTFACRSIRAQKIAWDANGLPLLGYPMNPTVKSWAPSGDMGTAGWGDSHSGGAASRGWTYNSPSSVDSANGSGGMQQTFRGELNPCAYSISAGVQLGNGSAGQFGIFANYINAANHVEAYLDTTLGNFVSSATVSGVAQTARRYALPANFDWTAAHTIKVTKSAAQAYTFWLDGMPVDSRTLGVNYGQMGLMASSAGAQFRGITVFDLSFGWGDAYGDAAQGLARTYSSAEPEIGYRHGNWSIVDGSTVESSAASGDWNAIYRGNPNLINYTVQVIAQLANVGTSTTASRFGLVACHDDRNNHLTVWLDAGQGILTWNAVVLGHDSWDSVALPSDFDVTQPHSLAVTKKGNLFSFMLDDHLVAQPTVELLNGSAGVATQNAHVFFRNFSISEE
jgi:GH43 family beta-xylosidase